MDIAVAFGKAVKIRRVELGVTQESLADAAGFSRRFLSGVEQGSKVASLRSIDRLAKALQCKPSDLLLSSERLMATRSPVAGE